MAEAAAAATNPGMDRYNRYYNAVLQQLQADQGPERSDSQLKNYLTRMIRPTYDQAIAQRQQQTGQANAMIDTDAASRGMGTSTWVTDAKNRQRNSEAADIANINNSYNTTLYDNLLGLINQRDQNRLNLMGQAQSIAGNMYDRWKAEDDALAAKAAGSGGGGGGGGGGRTPGSKNPPGDEVDPGYGTGLNPKAPKQSGLTEDNRKGVLTPTTYTQNLTQLQREQLGLDDKINGRQPERVTVNPLVNPKETVNPYKGYGITTKVTKKK